MFSTIMIFLIPALISVVLFKVFFNKDITAREFGFHAIGAVICTAVIYGISLAAVQYKMYDTEILSGSISNKYVDTIVCTEYSSCRNYYYKTEYYTTYVNGKLKRKSRQVKVFRYSTEYNYMIETTLNTSFEVPRVDDRGSIVPSRFKKIQIGEYAAAEHSYKNPLLMAKVSLFNTDMNSNLFSPEEMEDIPDYPRVKGDYLFNPFVNRTSIDINEYRHTVNGIMRSLGKSKQVNTVFVLYDVTKEVTKFKEKVLQKWNGGKKNDVILFIGVDNTKTIKEFDSVSFASSMGNEYLHSVLKMHFLGSNLTFDSTSVMQVMKSVDEFFKRTPASDFEYIVREVQPSPLLSLLVVLITCIIGVFFVRNDERN